MIDQLRGLAGKAIRLQMAGQTTYWWGPYMVVEVAAGSPPCLVMTGNHRYFVNIDQIAIVQEVERVDRSS